MNSEDREFVESLNCWEDNYDVITDNIQKLSGMLSLQIQLLQNIQEEKEHQRNVRHMTLEEQNISRLLNSFEQRFNVELSKLTDFSSKLDTLLTGQQVLVIRVAQIEEKLAEKEVTINSPISVKSEEGNSVDINKHLYNFANKVSRRHLPQTMSDKEFMGRLTKVLVDSEKAIEKNKEGIGKEKFIARANEIDWNSLKVEKPTIRLLDDKGNVINFECQIKDDGSITCVNKDAVIVDGTLNRDNCQVWKQVYKESIATKTKPKTMVKVGIISEDGILEFHRPNSLEIPSSPSVYSRDWFIEDNYATKEVLKFKSITSPVTWCTEIATKIGTPNVENKYLKDYNVTGYLTEDGRAVYYDQYL